MSTVPYSQKSVDGRSKWRACTRETEARLDGVMVALGYRGITVKAVMHKRSE